MITNTVIILRYLFKKKEENSILHISSLKTQSAGQNDGSSTPRRPVISHCRVYTGAGVGADGLWRRAAVWSWPNANNIILSGLEPNVSHPSRENTCLESAEPPRGHMMNEQYRHYFLEDVHFDEYEKWLERSPGKRRDETSTMVKYGARFWTEWFVSNIDR